VRFASRLALGSLGFFSCSSPFPSFSESPKGLQLGDFVRHEAHFKRESLDGAFKLENTAFLTFASVSFSPRMTARKSGAVRLRSGHVFFSVKPNSPPQILYVTIRQSPLFFHCKRRNSVTMLTCGHRYISLNPLVLVPPSPFPFPRAAVFSFFLGSPFWVF